MRGDLREGDFFSLHFIVEEERPKDQQAPLRPKDTLRRLRRRRRSSSSSSSRSCLANENGVCVCVCVCLCRLDRISTIVRTCIV